MSLSRVPKGRLLIRGSSCAAMAASAVVSSCPVLIASLLLLPLLDRGALRELLRVLMLPDLDRAERIGEFWSYPQSRTFAELLIDCEEDRVVRAVLVGMLREADRER
jgi:hypothetical protein